MSDNTQAPPPLGPGADDPRSPAAAPASSAAAPLGPGDDDPRSPVKGEALPALMPLGPGESMEEEDGLEMFAPAPPGPGDAAQTPRHVTHAPKRQPTQVGASAPVKTEPVAEIAAPADEDNKE